MAPPPGLRTATKNGLKDYQLTSQISTSFFSLLLPHSKAVLETSRGVTDHKISPQ